MAVHAESQRPSDLVDEVFSGYKEKGVFRSYSLGETRAGRTTYRMRWHREQIFEAILDTKRKSVRFPIVLPEVPADSGIDPALREFIARRQSDSLPEHRRIDPAKVEVKTFNRGGNIAITFNSLDEDYEYAARKLVHLVHEIYLEMLVDSRFYDYMVETFDIDPDHP